MADKHSRFSRRDVLKTTGVSGAAAGLSGCSALFGGGGDGGGGDGGAAPGDQQTTIPDEPIEAGLQTFLEGAASVFGLEIEAGTEMAVEDINSAGGVAGREINLETVHEGGAQVENYQTFVEQGKDVTLGPTSSGGHKAMGPVIEDEGVINMGNDGTTTALYEETIPNPTYSFRFQNYNTTEVVAGALAAVRRIGAENINTIAGINPDYEFGQDEMKMFKACMKKLTGAEVVYEGYPPLGASDMSTHITAVNNEQPDVLFTSMWGGDTTLFFNQASGASLYDNVGAIVGTVIGTDRSNVSRDMIDGANIIAGDRNYVFDHPDWDVWPPGQSFAQRAQEKLGYLPSYPTMSGYGSMMTWATAAQKAVDVLGRWPSQEELARAIEHHSIFTPGGMYHMSKYGGHQGIGTHHYGQMEWSDELSFPVLRDIEMFKGTQIVPPEGTKSMDWINSWEV